MAETEGNRGGITDKNNIAAPSGRWISVQNRDGGRGDPALRFAKQMGRMCYRAEYIRDAKAQGHYGEASGPDPE